jgi:N-acetylmuramoyl-L-alanine amidase
MVKRLLAAALLIVAMFAAPASAEEAAGVATPACDSAHFRIVLDVGHTALVYGQLSVRGTPEFEFNKNLANIVLEALHNADFPLAQMRIQESNDLFLRARDLDSLHPDLILSLHHDGVQDRYLMHDMIDGVYRDYTDKFAGYSLFVSYDNPERDNSLLFAKLLGAELISRNHKFTMHHAENIPGENRPVLDGKVGVFRYDKLVVLRKVSAPAVLMESAVIINPDDEALALQPDYQTEIAASVVAAVTRYCALRPKPAAQPTPEPKKSSGAVAKSKVQPKPEAKPESKPEPKLESKPESKPAAPVEAPAARPSDPENPTAEQPAPTEPKR